MIVSKRSHAAGERPERICYVALPAHSVFSFFDLKMNAFDAE